MGVNPSHFSRRGGGRNAVVKIAAEELKKFPVEKVSWNDAQRFLEKLNQQEKEPGWVYRLPREAEWEYACRGGPTTDRIESAFDFYFERPTNQLLPALASHGNWTEGRERGLKRPGQVGSYKANRLGLYDMHGNVHEWCDDAVKAPDGTERRVYRGGCWHDSPRSLRAAFRSEPQEPAVRLMYLGLRVARVPAEAAGRQPSG